MSEGDNGLSKWRRALFGFSFAAAAFSAVATVIDWTVPFPLINYADGSFGIWRWLLIATGLLLSALSVIGFVGSHR
jgi:hypothetical protein